MAKHTSLAVILAAGEGKRMRSDRAKVLHEIGGRPMLGHVLSSVAAARIDRAAVVVGVGGDTVADYLRDSAPEVAVYRQKGQHGTAHAVLAARRALADEPDHVLVLYGDTPFVTPATLRRVRQRLARGADVVVLGFRSDDPTGYGRLLVEKGRLLAIREQADASADELDVDLCNAGIMGFAGAGLVRRLKRIGNGNAKGEFYLTDMVEVVNRAGGRVVAMEVAAAEVLGINARVELAAAEAAFQARARREAMAAGVTMIAPETVWLTHDTKLGRDVVIEPNVFFGPGVTVGAGATILANSHIVGATIAENARIGPFARLRPGARIGEGARVGNFVEVKNAELGKGAKVNHLTYIGDASIGAAANIGAGTITCNYDGFTKHRTEIGDGAFIGSNSSLIAPVTVGDGAYIGSGSVISRNVEDDALAVGRARQIDRPGWAAGFRRRHAGNRKATKKR